MGPREESRRPQQVLCVACGIAFEAPGAQEGDGRTCPRCDERVVVGPAERSRRRVRRGDRRGDQGASGATCAACGDWFPVRIARPGDPLVCPSCGTQVIVQGITYTTARIWENAGVPGTGPRDPDRLGRAVRRFALIALLVVFLMFLPLIMGWEYPDWFDRPENAPNPRPIPATDEPR